MTISVTELTSRTKMVGRQEELEQLKDYLLAPGSESHFVYYWAGGGLGKTRLLEELVKMVREAGPKFYTTGIIDLYHTDTHSTSDLERTIVQNLDPAGQYFVDYRQAREYFELLREKGADPGILERHRRQLGDYFVKGCQEMALEASKIALCFDTVELLQYESSVVEEKADLDTADTRVKPWLLERLSKLSNVLVVFAGRPQKPSPGEIDDPQQKLVDDMQAAFGDKLDTAELKPLTLEETQTFIEVLSEEQGREVVPEKYLTVVHRLTNGRPIFLHLIADLVGVLEPGRDTLKLFDDYMELSEKDEQLEDARQDIERRILYAVFNVTFDRAMITTQLKLNEDPLWGKHHQRWLENDLISLKSDVFVSSVERRPYQGSNYAFCARWGKGHVNGPEELNWYLKKIALAPKGVDAQIFQVLVGCSFEEAKTWLDKLENLSFVKRFKPPEGSVRLHSEHIFLHDEMYQLLTSEVDPHLRREQRAAASQLVNKYYNPEVNSLEEELAEGTPEERIEVRERLQKLQVERLYYLLASDVRKGYQEYKELTEQSSRNRWTGFGMRLLDEFLRFYNDRSHRARFENSGLTEEQIIRESAWLWVERFYWWAQNERIINLTGKILDNPEAFYIFCSEDATSCSTEDLALLGNIYAYRSNAMARSKGYNLEIADQLRTMLNRFPHLAQCTDEQTLAFARLANAYGYQKRLGGMLNQATKYYGLAEAAFRNLGQNLELHQDEYAGVLTNSSYVYAILGRMSLARPLAHKALRLNELQDNRYKKGLTLSTLSQIARMRENFGQALDYAEEALHLFRELGEARGTAMAYLGVAQAKRKQAKHELEKGRNLEEAREMFEEARESLNKAQEATREAGITSLDAALIAEQGRVSRDLGRMISRLEGSEDAMAYYSQSARQLREALGKLQERASSKDMQADVLQDLSEVLFDLGDQEEAQRTLEKIKELIGQEYLIEPGKPFPADNLPPQHFEPLGKLELMIGQVAFSQKHWEEGIQHFVIAYMYFTRFSADAVKKDTMIEYLYNHLQGLPVTEQQEALKKTEVWVKNFELGDEALSFVQTVGELFGI